MCPRGGMVDTGDLKSLCLCQVVHTEQSVAIRRLLSGQKLARWQKLKNNARCGRDGMVDIPDLKSEGRMPVWVRVPPPAPLDASAILKAVLCIMQGQMNTGSIA